MPPVHQVLQSSAEEVVLRLGGGLLGAHRRAPYQGDPDRITPRPASQPTCRFARFSPSIPANPANPDTSGAPKNRGTPPLPAYFTGDHLADTNHTAGSPPRADMTTLSPPATGSTRECQPW